MSQDQDPIDATRSFEPVDPYNIPPEQAGGAMPGYQDYGYQQEPGHEQQPYGAAPPPPASGPRGLKQRLTRLGPLKLAVLGTAGVIVLGGAAWGTTAAFQSGSSSSNTAAAAPATDQSQGQAPGAGATTGAPGKRAKTGKAVRLKVSQAQDGTIVGVDPKGEQLTVAYDAATKFGTKKNPLKPEDLRPGAVIVVVGARDGDKITATAIAVSPKAAHGPADSGTATTPTDPASPVGGNA